MTSQEFYENYTLERDNRELQPNVDKDKDGKIIPLREIIGNYNQSSKPI